MLHLKKIQIFFLLLSFTSTASGQSSHLDFLLMEAIQNGDPKTVNDIIERGANVHAS